MNADAQNKGYKIPSYQQQSVYIVILFSILTVHIKKKVQCVRIAILPNSYKYMAAYHQRNS